MATPMVPGVLDQFPAAWTLAALLDSSRCLAASPKTTFDLSDLDLRRVPLAPSSPHGCYHGDKRDEGGTKRRKLVEASSSPRFSTTATFPRDRLTVEGSMEPSPLQLVEQALSSSSASSSLCAYNPLPSSDLEDLPDDVLSMILGHAAEGCHSPGDFINLLMTSRRMCHLGGHGCVLRRLPPSALRMSASGWSPAALRYLTQCSKAGNPHARYALGMIAFYCLGRPGWGLRLLAQAALAKNSEALFSLAVIHFNGSGGSRPQRDIQAGVLFCTQAVSLGHADATRELGHCLQDGYGVERDPLRGRNLLKAANKLESCQAARLAPEAAAQCGSARKDVRLGTSSPATQCPESAPNVTDTPHAGCPHQPGSAHHRCAGEASETLPSDAAAEASQSQAASAANPGSQPPHLQPQHSQPLSQTPSQLERDSNQSLTNSQAPQQERQDRQPLEEHQPGAPPGNVHHPFQAHFPSSTGAHGGGHHSARHPVGAPAGSPTAHQCFCLPAVTLPLHLRPMGWVHKFLRDWHRFLEVNIAMLPSPFTPALEGHWAQTRSLEGLESLLVHGRDTDRRLCTNVDCGRIELRENEFRCCSTCADVRYCSRVCQAEDWKAAHKILCHRLVAQQGVVGR